MLRRLLLAALLVLPAASCCSELGRYHSSVKFSLSNDAPAVGEPIEITFDYLDQAPAGSWSMVLIQQSSGATVDSAPVDDSSSRVTLTPGDPGPHSVECRRDGRMIAHRAITVR